MKKKVFCWMIPFLPVLFGCGLNAVMGAAASAGRLGLLGRLYLIIHLAFLILWFFAGWAYGGTRLPAPAAALLGNLLGPVSLALYLWQFLLVDDGARNMALAFFSQMFCTAGLSLGSRIGVLLEPDPHVLTRVGFVGAVIFATLFLILVFAAGVLVKCLRDWRNRAPADAEQVAAG